MKSEENCCANFALSNEPLTNFVSPKWPKFPRAVYVVWRWLCATYVTIWIILSGTWSDWWFTNQSDAIKWFIYVTNWAFLLFNLSLIIRAVFTLVYFTKYSSRDLDLPDPSPLPWYFRISWVLYNISSTMTLVVTVAYWGLLFNPGSTPFDAVDVHSHGINAVLLLVDLFITAHPARFSHFYQPVLAFLTYIVFTIIYDYMDLQNAYGASYIYSILDWTEDPMWASVYAVAVVFGGTPALWVVWCVLARIREAIYNCTRVGSDNSGPPV